MRRLSELRRLKLGAAFLTPAMVFLWGCDPTSIQAGPAQPATESTVLGTWRSTEPDSGGRYLKMTLRVDSNHTLIWARRWSWQTATDTEFVRETCDWKVEGGKFAITKTHCEYSHPEAQPPDFKLTLEACREPLRQEFPIEVKGGAWTLKEGDKPRLFRKDGYYN